MKYEGVFVRKRPFSSLLHLWEFNGNAIDIVNGLNLSTSSTGSVSYIAGKIKNSVYFNRGHLIGPSGRNLNINNNQWTISYWTNIVTFGNAATDPIVGILNRSVGSTNFGTRLIFSTPNVFYVNYCNSNTQLNSTVTFGPNIWVHIALKPPNIFFINGTRNAPTGNTMTTLNIGNPVYVGLDNYTAIRTMQGQMEQLAVWTRQLTDAEILSIYNSGNGLDFNLWGNNLK